MTPPQAAARFTAPVSSRRWSILVRLAAGATMSLALAACGDRAGSSPPVATPTETVLYSFAGGTDGAHPAGLVMDASGNLYGTTDGGGASNDGTVFKITPAGTESVLYSFAGGADGAHPAGLVLGADGNLYGITANGGTSNDGTVFKITD